MSEPGFQYVVFVDFENVPEVDLGLIEGKSAHVSLLLGKNQKKLEVGLVRRIQQLSAQVELVEVGASGHNALDITLAYYLGRAVQRSPGAQFCIVSGDKDFDATIGHLFDNGVKISRHGGFTELPFVPGRVRVPAPPKAVVVAKPTSSAKPRVAASKTPEDRIAKVTARLLDPANLTRPSTQKALVARIKTDLGKQYTEAAIESVLQKLRNGGVRFDVKNRVTY